MTRYHTGVLAALAVAAVLGPPGAAVQGRQPTSTGAPPVHSVTITLAPSADGKTCEIKALSPEAIGVYRGDTLVWHVENGCPDPAAVTIRDLTLVEPKTDSALVAFKYSQNWSKQPVEVAAWRREQISASVIVEPAPGTRYSFEYSVQLKRPTGGPPDLKGQVMICQQPPCWPPAGMKPPRR